MAVPTGKHLWRHGTEWGAAAGVTVFAAVAGSGHIPTAMVIAIAFVAGATGVLVGWVTTDSAPLAWAMCGWWVLLTGWAGWARVTSPWHPAPVTVWAAGVTILTAVTVLAVAHHQETRADLAKARAARDAKAELRRWEDLLARTGIDNVTCKEVRETRAGKQAHLHLPKQGVSLEKLQHASPQLDIAMRLHRGANRFEPGRGAADVVWQIIEKDVLAQECPYPVKGPFTRSINEPVDVGLHEDGSVCTVTLREVASLIVGLRGAGKSNLINVLIARLAECYDAVIFLIDMKGGRTAKPWLTRWAANQNPSPTTRPVVDWVATGREEAETMLDALLTAIDYRAASGIGGEKITPSNETPAIIVICDEVAVIFGDSGPRSGDGTTSSNYTLAGKGTKITQLGRSEAVDPIWCAQRGGVTMLGKGDLKSQSGLRFALSVASEADARMVIPDDPVAAKILAKIKQPGAGLVFAAGQTSQPVKFYRLDPERIEEIAAATGEQRPALDTGTAAAMGEAYAKRWDRATHLVAQAKPPTPEDDSTGGEFTRIIAQLGDLSEETASEARQAMRDVVAKHSRWPRAGAAPTPVAAELAARGFKTRRETVTKWMREDAKTGVLVQTGRGLYRPADLDGRNMP